MVELISLGGDWKCTGGNSNLKEGPDMYSVQALVRANQMAVVMRH